MARHTAKSHKIRKVEILVIQIYNLLNKDNKISEDVQHLNSACDLDEMVSGIIQALKNHKIMRIKN